MQEYQILGKEYDKTNGPLYKLLVFAENEVIAKSRFYKTLEKRHKLKKAVLEILSVKILAETQILKARTYGLWLRLRGTTRMKNMYKEVRATSRCKAVTACFLEVKKLYKKDYFEVEIVSVVELKPEEIKREEQRQYAADGLRFPNMLPKKNTPRGCFSTKAEFNL